MILKKKLRALYGKKNLVPQSLRTLEPLKKINAYKASRDFQKYKLR